MSTEPSACSDASVERVEENVPLARYTTIGTGGPARWFAKPTTIDELQDALRWARDRDVLVETIGLGSNVLAHDDGVEALVLKLDGELVATDVDGRRARGGGRRAQCGSTASCARSGSRRVRVRSGDSRHGRRRCAHERGGVRPRMEGRR